MIPGRLGIINHGSVHPILVDIRLTLILEGHPKYWSNQDDIQVFLSVIGGLGNGVEPRDVSV